MVKNTGFGFRDPRVGVLAPLLTNCVTSGNLLNLSLHTIIEGVPISLSSYED